MCGRFALNASVNEVAQEFDAWIEESFPHRYNISPTQPILIIRAPEAYRDKTSNRPRYDSMLARWGFIPAWTKDPDRWPLTFNIRAETVAEKKSFTNALKHHRVIIPATGFYEWKKGARGKSQPFYIQSGKNEVIGFAGLMETWSGQEGSQVDTAAIITSAAKAPLSAIHHRMPVIIKRQDYERWLDCRNYRPSDVLDILQQSNVEQLEMFPVSEKINSATYLGDDVQNHIVLQDNKNKDKTTKNTRQLDLF